MIIKNLFIDNESADLEILIEDLNKDGLDENVSIDPYLYKENNLNDLKKYIQEFITCEEYEYRIFVDFALTKSPNDSSCAQQIIDFINTNYKGKRFKIAIIILTQFARSSIEEYFPNNCFIISKPLQHFNDGQKPKIVHRYYGYVFKDIFKEEADKDITDEYEGFKRIVCAPLEDNIFY